MRVLFVSNHFPRDLNTSTQGIYKRMGLFIDALKAIAQLDMLFFVPPNLEVTPELVKQLEQEFSRHWNAPINLFLCPQQSSQSAPKWKRNLAGIFNLFDQADFAGTTAQEQVHAFERCLTRNPDAVFIHRLFAMCPAMLTQEKLPPLFFDLDDVEHIRFMREIKQPPARLFTRLYYLQVPARWWGELKAIRLAEQTFVCSEHDRHYLLNRWGLSKVVNIPNAISIPQSHPLPPQPTLLLLGGYYYFPNANAANFLIEQVLPRIHRVIPNAHLIIAGSKPEAIRSYGKNLSGVEFTGFVKDLDALYQRSRVVCCPIFSGGGTRVKMIEAAAYGKPIVATRIGSEGLEMTDGKDFLLRNDAQDFADACIELLQNDALCVRLGHAARAIAIQHYDRSTIVQLIQKHISSVMQVPTQGHAYASHLGA